MPRRSAISVSDVDLIMQIKQEVQDITISENFPDIGKGFVFWILKNYFDLDREIAAASVIDSPNDKRVDAFIEEDEIIKIIQCKFFDNPRKEVGGNEIVLFKGCLDWLKKPEEVKRLNLPSFYDVASTFSERWEEGVDVQLHFFTFGRFSNEAHHERIVFNNTDLRERVQMYFHDIEDILALYKSKSQKENPLVNERITLELTPGEYFVKRGDMPSVVATIKGKDLLTMYKKYGDNLFERNIRFYRGARKGSINAKIIDTILDDNEQQKFWYYNNGISFVCRNFSVKDDVNPPILEVQGFQVINGCQTTVCLSEAKQRAEGWENIPDEVQIVVRFIKAPVKEVDLITLYTNSQNPVSEIQLKSNDLIQKRLKEELARYSSPYFYSIKEGDWQKLSAKEKRNFRDRVIEMSEAAQAIYSFTNDPAFARRWKNKLFSEKYYEIFRKDISAEEIILPWRIRKVINERIAKYRREEFNKVKKEPFSFTEEEKTNVLKKEFLIYSNLIILYFIGKLIQKRYRQYTSIIAKKLLNKKLEERITRIFDYIIGILRFSERLTQETNPPRFLKNFDNIIYNEIQKAVEMDHARAGKDPLREMLPEI
ncbi:MAG: AIPR family protein [Nitrospira sp.]|nr:AIPR family protein [Nitrospira sp.]